jgi:hypothetical protein
MIERRKSQSVLPKPRAGFSGIFFSFATKWCNPLQWLLFANMLFFKSRQFIWLRVKRASFSDTFLAVFIQKVV